MGLKPSPDGRARDHEEQAGCDSPSLPPSQRDGRNYLVYIDDDGFVGCLRRYASNRAPGNILNALANVFDTNIVSEHRMPTQSATAPFRLGRTFRQIGFDLPELCTQ